MNLYRRKKTRVYVSLVHYVCEEEEEEEKEADTINTSRANIEL